MFFADKKLPFLLNMTAPHTMHTQQFSAWHTASIEYFCDIEKRETHKSYFKRLTERTTKMTKMEFFLFSLLTLASIVDQFFFSALFSVEEIQEHIKRREKIELRTILCVCVILCQHFSPHPIKYRCFYG